MQVIGSGILFALGDVNVTLTGLGSLSLLQSCEVSFEAEEEVIKDSSGNTKNVTKYDRRKKATLEFIPTSGTNTGTVVVTDYPAIGTTITITDANYTPIQGAWIVDALNLTRSNTKALMARINLTNHIDGGIPA